MTFSIVGRCARTGQLGVGAVTAMPGVGKLVTHAAPHRGAIATQAMINPYLGLVGLELLGEPAPAAEVRDRLISADPGRQLRQLGIVDAAGEGVGYTGEQTPPWAGHLTGEGFVTQGNRLVGRSTLEAVADVFTTRDDLDLAERVLLALEAGEETGADLEGAVSGTVYVMDTEDYPLWDLRVDSADDPVAGLRDLHGHFLHELVPSIKQMPTRDDWLGEADREALGQDAG